MSEPLGSPFRVASREADVGTANVGKRNCPGSDVCNTG